MRDITKTVAVFMTLLTTIGGIIFSGGIMIAKINENTSAIDEHKLSGKTVKSHGNRITQLEIERKHLKELHLNNKTEIKSIRIRVRNLENGVRP